MSWDVSIPNTFDKDQRRSDVAFSSNVLMPSEAEEEDIFASRQFTTLIAFYGCLDVLPVHAL